MSSTWVQRGTEQWAWDREDRPADLQPDDLIRVRLFAGSDGAEKHVEEPPPGRAHTFAWSAMTHDGGFGRVDAYCILERSGVGDVNGTTLGSAARANTGKPRLDLIPAGIVAEVERSRPAVLPVVEGELWPGVLTLLDGFQMRVGVDRVFLVHALRLMDHDGNLWAEVADVLEYGLKKYSAWNWARGQAWSIPIGSAMRHIVFGLLRGETIDAESGKAHRGHVGANIVFLLWFLSTYPEGDDRPTLPVRRG